MEDKYQEYVKAVLEEVPEAESWSESLFEKFRQFEEEYYIPPRDAVRTVIRFAKELLQDGGQSIEFMLKFKIHGLTDMKEAKERFEYAIRNGSDLKDAFYFHDVKWEYLN